MKRAPETRSVPLTKEEAEALLHAAGMYAFPSLKNLVVAKQALPDEILALQRAAERLHALYPEIAKEWEEKKRRMDEKHLAKRKWLESRR